MWQLLVEIAVVAAVTAALFWGIDRVLKQVPSWAVAGIVGGVAHGLLDLTGANKWYCVNGFACKA